MNILPPPTLPTNEAPCLSKFPSLLPTLSPFYLETLLKCFAHDTMERLCGPIERIHVGTSDYVEVTFLNNQQLQRDKFAQGDGSQIPVEEGDGFKPRFLPAS